MADSTHPYDRPTGGKGDRDIRTNPQKYRDAIFWKRSMCCNYSVSRDEDKFRCQKCGNTTIPK